MTKITKENILLSIGNILEREFGIDKFKPENRYKEDLDFDSLDDVEFVMAMEEMYNIEISDSNAENIKTVQQTIDYIYDHTKEQG